MEAAVRSRPASRLAWVATGRHALERMSVKVVELRWGDRPVVYNSGGVTA